ncbi:MAG: NAD-dependent epimerase/dehydratase family protein [Gammaproteobacteria bacterium]|nr:NAD-dependent epimerase/dehydratase family protein [Gammaproteobacteria bacterium]
MGRVVVLGAGMVGSAIARDLKQNHEVTSVDLQDEALAALSGDGIRTRQADLSDEQAVRDSIAKADLVICAVPGFMGRRTLGSIIDAGKPVVDISFMPEDALELDSLARERGVTAVVDMGVAPGMDNVIFGYHDTRMKVERFECLVGGLPQARTYPFEYKAPFSPIDVIEEYTRPARFVVNGELVTRPALSEPELVEFEKPGTLEAFNSDGLRSLISTMAHVPDMKEKTLRYRGHRDLMAALDAGGFFSTEPIAVAGHKIRAIDASSAILLAAWKLAPDEKEFTVMRVTLEGEESGERVRYVYDLYDEFDTASQTSSMARTTGYACAAAAELLLSGTYGVAGVSAPEMVGRAPGCYEAVMKYQRDRGISYKHRREII